MSIINIASSITDAQVTEHVMKERELPRAGVALLRLKSYLELGLHAPKNPTHKDARKVRLVFELLHPDHVISGTKQDGSTYSFPDSLSVYINIAGPTSRFGKLFAKMNYDGTATHMSQLVGAAFLGTITHNEYQGKTYANLDLNGEWQIGAPTIVDPMTNKVQVIPVPEMDGDPQVFIYEHPQISDSDIKIMWDSIFIDGERPSGESKNWIQGEIMNSLNWDTSRTKRATEGSAELDVSFTEDDDLAALGL